MVESDEQRLESDDEDFVHFRLMKTPIAQMKAL
jgi:hypothetical protein